MIDLAAAYPPTTARQSRRAVNGVETLTASISRPR
jgi:hypothetical protein